jgi:cell division transport system permease protein
MTVLMSHAGRRNRHADRREADPDQIGSDATPLRREMPLVPAASIAGRALITVIAIMTFLASLAAGTAILITEASRGWQSSTPTRGEPPI